MSTYRLTVTTLTLMVICLSGVHQSALASGSYATQSNEVVSLTEGPVPSPELGPGEVVRIQLEALRDNDETDQGIAVCFRFASPSNQANTGPLPRFGQMIKDGPYRLMLEYHNAEYAEVEVHEDHARQRVTLRGVEEIITYAFYLSSQTHSECDGCWMTDAVTIENVEKPITASLTRLSPDSP